MRFASLRRLVTNLPRRRPRPLTLAAVEAHFRRRGYTVERKSVNDIDLFFHGQGLGLFCVMFQPNPPDAVLLPTLVRQAEAREATLVFICAGPISQLLHEEALHRFMLLIQWSAIESFEAQFQYLRSYRQTELSEAKRHPAAELPPPTASLLIPLTTRQQELGYLFRTEQISCFLVDRGGTTLLVTFAPWGSDPERPGRVGDAYGKASGFSTLGFETAAPNWYPHHHMLECLQCAAGVIDGRFTRRLLVGASQGGYAAIRYSGLLAADVVLAFSPAYSIDPAITSDRRFAAHYKPELQSGMHIAARDVQGATCVVFDPTELADTAQVDLLRPELPFAGFAPVWFVGHGCQRLTRDTNLVVQLLAGGCNAAEVQSRSVSSRHQDPVRAFRMAMWLADRRPRTALRIFRFFSPMMPDYEWWKVCYRLSQAGLAGDVIDWLAASAAQDATNADLQASTAIAAERSGKLDLAYDAITLALKQEPHSPKFLHIQHRVIKQRSIG